MPGDPDEIEPTVSEYASQRIDIHTGNALISHGRYRTLRLSSATGGLKTVIAAAVTGTRPVCIAHVVVWAEGILVM